MISWLNPLSGEGYAFWSGIGSGSPILAGFLLIARKHNCHEPRCWRMQFRAHPMDDGHLVCRTHYREAQ